MPILGTAIALVVLAVPVAVCALLLPHTPQLQLLYYFLYLALAIIGWFVWRHERAPQTPREWLRVLGWLLVVNILSFIVDMGIGQLNCPEHSLLVCSLHVFGPLGSGFTLLILPCAILVAVAGLARSAYLQWRGTPNNRWRGPWSPE